MDFSWILLFSLFASICFSLTYDHQGLPPCKSTTYSYSTFALTWMGEYCTENKCSKNWKDVWDGSSFLIHGYWPSSKDLAYLSCQQQDGYDKNCYQAYAFNESKVSDLKKDLNAVWPQIGSIKNFWAYEWDKHGTCYLKLTQDGYNSKKLTKDDIFYRFFRGAIQKYKSLTLNVTQSNFKTKQQFGKVLKLDKDQFIVVCGDDNELDQIRICYNLAQPQKQTIIKCPSKPKQCTFPIVLKGE